MVFSPLRLACAALLAALPAFSAPPIRILPMGDSITEGASYDSPDGTGGYRGPLYNLLTGAGYNVDYIGSLTQNSELLVEKNHEGHPGWMIDQLDVNIEQWFASYEDPDVILLLIGTNDFFNNNDITHAIDRLDAMIVKMATLRPYAHIIVSNLLEKFEPQNTQIQQYFNAYVQQRVAAHAAAGRRVTFVDLRSTVPLSQMPDQIHPNQTGYNAMAAKWLQAIQAVIGPDGDSLPPALVRARGSDDRTHVTVRFSKPVADSAADLSHYAFDGGLAAASAALDDTKRIVTLTTNEMAPGAAYTVTVNGVQDRLASPNTIAANSTAEFHTAIPRGYLDHVSESADYTLACSLDVPAVANYKKFPPAYSVDNRAAIGAFDRVAYYVELQSEQGDLQYLWVSMAAFTADPFQIGVPTLATGAVFQRSVSDLHVVSNVPGVANGEGDAGNLEFWPFTYGQTNAANVPGASATTYDFGDSNDGSGAFGSMQVHDTTARRTLFAFNDWAGDATAANADLGIGSRPTGDPDWTFAANAGGYVVRTIQVLVRSTGDTTRPAVASAQESFGGSKVTVRFSEPILATTATADRFAVSGATVLGVSVLANQRDVVLATTRLSPGAHTLAVNDVRDTSPNANVIEPGTTVPISAPALPPEIIANAGAAADGYELVCALDVPVVGNLNALGSAAYAMDDTDASRPFTRVAYYLETQAAGQAPKWVWVSMDAFTTDTRKLGVPTVATGAFFQQNVTNMQVVSNLGNVKTGSGFTGSIEFWPGNYDPAKAAASPPNASDAIFDFGDSGGSVSAGYGSMQVHNPSVTQTVFAINGFGIDGKVLDVGVGSYSPPSANSSGPQRDWTFSETAGNYVRRTLYVCVLPDPDAPPGPDDTTPPAIMNLTGSSLLNRLIVAFDEPVSDSSAAPENFSIAGLAVTGARLLGGGREVALFTGNQTPGADYTLTITGGVRDRSPNGNEVPANTTAHFTGYEPPAVVSGIPETSDYVVVKSLAIPAASGRWNVNPIPYDIDEAKYGDLVFDRVAYLLQLDSNWAYASFDTFTHSLAKVGVPAAPVTSMPFQQNVAHMNVASNVAGVVTGSGIATGNIEFWNGDYTETNALNIPGASSATFDFGDQMTPGVFGTMQIHNHGASQTILAYNNWGSNAETSDLGIGSQSTGSPDWTHAGNAAGYATRHLYVLVRPGGEPVGDPPLLLSQPTARAVDLGGATTLAVRVQGGGSFTYQWRKDGVPIPDSNHPWLEIDDFDLAKAGSYDVVVTGSNGVSTTSRAATVSRSNAAPVFAGYSFTVNAADSAVIPRAALLAKTTDGDADALEITGASAASAHGGAVALDAAAVTYSPAADYLGPDTFTVTIADDFGGSVDATVHATVTAAATDTADAAIAPRGDGRVDVLFRGTPGAEADVRRSLDLQSWTTLDTRAAGDDGFLPFTDDAPPPGGAFYRNVPK